MLLLYLIFSIFASPILASVYCPNPNDILPCTCYYNDVNGHIHMNCSEAERESDIEQAFQVPFPITTMDGFYFTNNKFIPEFTHEVFNGVTFDHMYMENSVLVRIATEFFTSQSNSLHYLYLQGNRLGDDGLSADMLSTLRSLKVLFLDHNGIGSIIYNYPDNNLVYLSLKFNAIEAIETNRFAGCHSVTTLLLNDNRLHTLTKGT